MICVYVSRLWYLILVRYNRFKSSFFVIVFFPNWICSRMKNGTNKTHTHLIFGSSVSTPSPFSATYLCLIFRLCAFFQFQLIYIYIHQIEILTHRIDFYLRLFWHIPNIRANSRSRLQWKIERKKITYSISTIYEQTYIHSIYIVIDLSMLIMCT